MIKYYLKNAGICQLIFHFFFDSFIKGNIWCKTIIYGYISIRDHGVTGHVFYQLYFFCVRHRSWACVIRETKKVYRNTVTALNRIKALNVAVKSTKTAVKSIKAGYRAGTRTNADLLRAQRELYKAKLDYEAAKYEYTANFFQLKNITGKLTKEDVELINAWFDI